MTSMVKRAIAAVAAALLALPALGAGPAEAARRGGAQQFSCEAQFFPSPARMVGSCKDGPGTQYRVRVLVCRSASTCQWAVGPWVAYWGDDGTADDSVAVYPGEAWRAAEAPRFQSR